MDPPDALLSVPEAPPPEEHYLPSAEDLRELMQRLLTDWIGKDIRVLSNPAADIPDPFTRGLKLEGSPLVFVEMRTGPSLVHWIRVCAGRAFREEAGLPETFQEFSALMICRIVTLLKEHWGNQFVFRMIAGDVEGERPQGLPDLAVGLSVHDHPLNIDLWFKE